MTLVSFRRFQHIRPIYLVTFLLLLTHQGYSQEEEIADYELIFLSEDPMLIGTGETTNGIKTGNWVYATKDSSFIQMGRYTETGYKNGFWQIFIEGAERSRMTFQNDTLTGKYVLFHPNRTPAVTTYMFDGELDGTWTSYTSKKQRYETGNFRKGKKIGEWLTYFPNLARPEIKAQYVDGLLEGEFKQYNPWAEMIIKTNYSKGALNGLWIKYDQQNVVEKGYFVEGKRDSTWAYYEFGTFASIREFYNKGKRKGIWTTYHSNKRKASRVTYENDKPVGIGRTWHTNKQLASETRYRLGLPDSTYIEYFKGGEIAVTGEWGLGLKKGTWKYFHENSLIAEVGQFESNQKSGNWKTFNESGRLVSEGDFRFGKEIGQWFNYHENGTLASIGSYKLSEKDGLWGFFHVDGKPMIEETWNDGKLISVSGFITNKGTILPSGSVRRGAGNRINYTAGGTKFSEGPYLNGLPNGLWSFYDEKERKLMYGNLANGVKEGQWMVYAKGGRVIRIETFKAGELTDSIIK